MFYNLRKCPTDSFVILLIKTNLSNNYSTVVGRYNPVYNIDNIYRKDWEILKTGYQNCNLREDIKIRSYWLHEEVVGWFPLDNYLTTKDEEDLINAT